MRSTHRLSSYSIDEDIHLCRVYLDKSQEYQPSAQLWSRVAVDYNANGNFIDRSQRSVQARMSIILRAILKFKDCIRQIEISDPIGDSDQTIRTRARALLAQDKNYSKGFRFDHVWDIFNDIPNSKDIVKFEDNDSVSSKQESPSFTSSEFASPGLSSINHNLNDDENIGVTSSRKRKSYDLFDKMIAQQNEILDIIKKNASDRARASELREENRILLADLNSISNYNVREFLRNEQLRIVRKRTQSQCSQNEEHGEGFQHQGSREDESQNQDKKS